MCIIEKISQKEMVIQVTLENYKSIKNSNTLNFTAIKPIKEFEDENVFEQGRFRLLKSAVIYGANASGKSNFLDGLNFLRWFVVNSSKESQVDDLIDVEPFLLEENLVDKPSSFEISFLIGEVKYRYGIEMTTKEVVSEYLLRSLKVKETPLFIRDKDVIEVFKDFKEGKQLESKTRKNALFLSVVAQFNGEIAGQIIKWFKSFNVISGLKDVGYEGFTASLFKSDESKSHIMNLIKYADLGISDIKVNDFLISKDTLPDDMPDEFKETILKETEGKTGYNIDTFHKSFSENGNSKLVKFDFDEQESEGTKKFFRLAGPIIDTLDDGGVLVVDELDARLHPLLTRQIVRMFNSKEVNKNNAQLIFATHDTNLLSACTFRRDQIWFVEKDDLGGSEAYALSDYKLSKGKVRKDASFEKDYMHGRYGAIPFLGNFDDLLNSKEWQE